MPDSLEVKFHEAMLDIYRRAKREAKYNAQRFLQMVVDHGGLDAARMLIHAGTVSDGYTALWERGRLDLTVEAMIVETPEFHPLFSDEERQVCLKRLSDYGYEKQYERLDMNPRVQKLKTVEECRRFAANATRLGREDLATEARQRAVEIQAEAHGAETAAERECLQAIYAYEEILSEKNGRRTRATRTWQMIERQGSILKAVEKVVNRPQETMGYTALAEMGLRDFAFEAVILRHPEAFSSEAVEKSKERMKSWTEGEH